MDSHQPSRYNIFVPFEGQTLLFNGLSGAMLKLSNDLAHLLKNCDLATFQNESPELFQALIKSRCLTPPGFDELDPIRKRNQRAVYENRQYHLTINPTMNCNFKCWYCYEGHVKSRMEQNTQDSLYRHVQLMIDEKKITALQLGWFGGEPLMTFSHAVYPLARRLKALCEEKGLPFHHSITTNGYLITPKHVSLFEEIGLKSFQITLDGDETGHNKIRFLKESGRPTFSRVVSNINLLIKELPDVQINLRINFQDETLTDIDSIITAFPRENRSSINLDFQRVWQTCGTTAQPNNRLQQAIDRFNEAGFSAHAAANEFVLHRANKCYADRWLQAVVNYDGNIFKCTARDFSPANSEGVLQASGEISWKGNLKKRFARAPWERERCIDCGLLPLCMGPCTQKMIEMGEANRNNYCWMDNLELTVEDYVIDRYTKLRNDTFQGAPV